MKRLLDKASIITASQLLIYTWIL